MGAASLSGLGCAAAAPRERAAAARESEREPPATSATADAGPSSIGGQARGQRVVLRADVTNVLDDDLRITGCDEKRGPRASRPGLAALAARIANPPWSSLLDVKLVSRAGARSEPAGCWTAELVDVK